MAATTNTLHLKSPVVKPAGTTGKRATGAGRDTYRFECDCCGALFDSITSFDNHLTWQCGRKYGCRVVHELPPQPGQMGTWYVENVQTGLQYQGNIIPDDGSHLTGLSQAARNAETTRKNDLRTGSFCSTRRSCKPRAEQMSYRQYQEKQWDGRLRRDPNRPEMYVDDMTVLNSPLAAGGQQLPQQQQQQQQPQPRPQPQPQPQPYPQPPSQQPVNREEVQDEDEDEYEDEDEESEDGEEEADNQEPERASGDNHRAIVATIAHQNKLDRQLRQVASREGGFMDTPPPNRRPRGIFWDGLTDEEGTERSLWLLVALRKRDVMFSRFETTKTFFELGFKFLKASDGDVEEAAYIAEKFHSEEDGEWSQQAWDEDRNKAVREQKFG